MKPRRERLSAADVTGVWAILPTPALESASDWRNDNTVNLDEAARAVDQFEQRQRQELDHLVPRPIMAGQRGFAALVGRRSSVPVDVDRIRIFLKLCHGFGLVAGPACLR